MDVEERLAALELVARQAGECLACRLSETRPTVGFEDGSRRARLMFIGEASGLNEDRQGLPFVGAAGQLLNELLGEIGLQREEVYIGNVLKCRPPGSRDHRPDEIESCKSYLAQQVKLVDPQVVVTLGNFASKLLLKTSTGITRLRGQAYPWWGRHVVPTFHPAAALRGGDRVTAQMREDLAIARDLLGEAPPPPPAEQLGLFS